MLRQIIFPVIVSGLMMTGCQTWPPQDPNRLPPSAALPAESQSGQVQVFYWDGISGTATENLTSIQRYPDAPDATDILSTLQGPTNRGEGFGSLVRGYIIPPQNGLYTFFVSGDDQTEFWLSSTEASSQKAKIAEVPGWTSPLSYTKYSSQRSGAIELQAGEKYYFEIIHKEGGGGDHFSVAWEGPNISRTIIGGENIASYAGAITGGTGESSDEESYRFGYLVGFHDGSQSIAFNPQFPPLDQDDDGIYDNWEVVYGLDPENPNDAASDPDNDLLVAADEFLLGTSENNADTDGDGIPDGAEFAMELNPLDSTDAIEDLDGDGVSNVDEYVAGTDPSDSSSLPEQETALSYSNGFVGQYFLGTEFNEFVLSRRNDSIQFSVGSEGFIEEQPADNFSARWFGEFTAPHSSGSREYIFYVVTDDGSRLYIDGRERISAWRDQGETTYSATVSLEPAQTVTLVMEYYERAGAAVAQLFIGDNTSGEILNTANVVASPDFSVSSGTDSDGDGIPDTWELRNGLASWEANASDINNSSGVTNLEAFNADLSPWTLTSLASPESPTVDDGGGITAPQPAPSSATLTWTAPLTRVDGSSIKLSEIASYEVTYGTGQNDLDNTVTVDGGENSVVIDGLTAGTWFFSIRVIDADGLASAYSEVVSKQIK
ncbi:PA14 domain-containing protein [Marinobacter adhaerens]|uniref:PA14 domain-containing protein n=1 Tax=Marinobacter adhaerens TaxID=1033846 RepID=UPI001C5663DA|nr:PA14 domain-containing protein [Marinobacter adhaerens]MBW3225642.1 hypothetical protein [Marinobacter adhaerens]